MGGSGEKWRQKGFWISFAYLFAYFTYDCLYKVLFLSLVFIKALGKSSFETNLEKIPENLKKNSRIPKKLQGFLNPKYQESSYAFFRVIYPSVFGRVNWKHSSQM
jgi:hypothetical protein